MEKTKVVLNGAIWSFSEGSYRLFILLINILSVREDNFDADMLYRFGINRVAP